MSSLPKKGDKQEFRRPLQFPLTTSSLFSSDPTPQCSTMENTARAEASSTMAVSTCFTEKTLVVSSVSNDVSVEQEVHKTANEMGEEGPATGMELKSSVDDVEIMEVDEHVHDKTTVVEKEPKNVTVKTPLRPRKGRRSSICLPRKEDSDEKKEEELATLISESLMIEPKGPLRIMAEKQTRLGSYKKLIDEESARWLTLYDAQTIRQNKAENLAEDEFVRLKNKKRIPMRFEDVPNENMKNPLGVVQKARQKMGHLRFIDSEEREVNRLRGVLSSINLTENEEISKLAALVNILKKNVSSTEENFKEIEMWKEIEESSRRSIALMDEQYEMCGF